MLKSITLEVVGDQRLVCEGCEQRVESLLKALQGVGKVRARARNQRIEVLFDATTLDAGTIAERLREAGYETRAGAEEAALNQRLVATGQSAATRPSRPPSLYKPVSAYLTLFTSLATLFCCALPALLVLVGLSLTGVLTFFTAIPGWQNFGAYDIWLFPLGAALLAVGFYFAYFRQPKLPGEACEIPAAGWESACSTATRWNRRILWLSLSLYSLALAMNFWGIGWMKAHGYFNH